MKKKYLIAGVILLIAAIVCILVFFGVFQNDESAMVDYELTTEEEEEETTEEAAEETEDAYESPIDFETLQAQNSDIYAWLDIPGTDISYPVLQNADDDTMYLDHGEDGSSSTAGALFTEHRYNSLDFSDPVTIIYGHHMRSGVYFGNLQSIYSDADNFEEYSEAVIYLPDSELHYTVYAAIPYDNRHILYYYDCTVASDYNTFLSTVSGIRVIGANYNEDVEVTTEDSLLILSTCLQGDNTQRYLVLFKLDEESQSE